MRLWITLEEETMSVVNETCLECRTKVKYDLYAGTPVYDEKRRPLKCSNEDVSYMDGVRPTNIEVQSATMKGLAYEDVLTFSFKDTGEMQFRDLAFCAIEAVTSVGTSTV